MNNIIKSNNVRTAENDIWKVFFNKVNFEGREYNLTMVLEKETDEIYFIPSKIGEIMGLRI